MNATVIGSTGLVGNFILSSLLASPNWTSISAISRRAPKTPDGSSSKLITILESDAAEFGKHIPPSSSVVFSALGTTRAAAGSLAAQWKIDHDANVSVFQAARKVPSVQTAVFISSSGTSSMIAKHAPYLRMKLGVEDSLKALDFPQTIILRPGMILGEREKKRGGAELVFQSAVRGLGSIKGSLQDMFGQEAEVIARAAVKAAEIAEKGEAPSKVWVLEAADIVKYGKMVEEDQDSSVAPATSTPVQGNGSK